MKAFLGLGSNVGDRRNYLETAIQKLKSYLNPKVLKVSPVYETPALLPPLGHLSWNKSFLNIAIELEVFISPDFLLETTQRVELELGRKRDSRWAPREIDIDILLIEEVELNQPFLRIPHPGIKKRAFVLDPLKDLKPSLKLSTGESILELARGHRQHSPLWMGIVNMTPDSFSDQRKVWSEEAFIENFERWRDAGVGIIDLGGESTRPNAEAVDADEEWRRLKPALLSLKKVKKGVLDPMVSIDTRHFTTALRAMEFEVDIINDVSGLADGSFMELLRQRSCYYVLTHSLGIPSDPKKTRGEDVNIMREMIHWFSDKIESLIENGISKEKLILDPGFGFGKNTLQSQIISRNLRELHSLGCRILVGHSRKSFIASLTSLPQERDFESVGASLAFVEKGVDILRVHDPLSHIKAFSAWNQLR